MILLIEQVTVDKIFIITEIHFHMIRKLDVNEIKDFDVHMCISLREYAQSKEN